MPVPEAIEIYSLMLVILNKYSLSSMYVDAYPVCYLINKIAKILKFPGFSLSPEINTNAIKLLVVYAKGMRFPSALYLEAARNLELAVVIYRGVQGDKPVANDVYIHCLQQLSILYYKQAEECVRTKSSDIKQTDMLYKQAIHWGTQYFEAKPCSDTLNKLSDSVTAFVRLSIKNKDTERALGALCYANEHVRKFNATDEYNEVGKHWLLGRHYQFMAEIYASQEQFQNEFETLLKARHAYANTKDYKIFERMNTALLVATIDKAKRCLFFQLDNQDAKARGWVALKNALIPMIHLDDEVKLAEIIAEFSQIVNMPKLLEAVHQELDAVTEKPHLKSIDLPSSTVGRFAARKDVKLEKPKVGMIKPRVVAAEDSQSKPRPVGGTKFFPGAASKGSHNRPDPQPQKRVRSPESVRRDRSPKGDRRGDRDKHFQDDRYARGDYKRSNF